MIHYHEVGTTTTHHWNAGTSVFYAENTFPTISSQFYFRDSATYLLNGFNQTISPGAKNDGYYFRHSGSEANTINSPVDKPANIILSQKYATDEYFGGKLVGAAGITWKGAANSLFRLTGMNSLTRGKLRVEQGEMITTNGTTFAQLSAIEVVAGAKFSVGLDSGDIYADDITVETDGELTIAAGRTLTCAHATLCGEVMEAGSYDFVGGTLVVEGHYRNYWKGANGANWSDAANWTRGAIATGDIVLITNGNIKVDQSIDAVPSQIVLSNGAKLTFASWNAVLKADAIALANGTSITIADAFTNDNQKCRVQIECGDLTIASGAAINLVGRGWHGGWSGHNAGYGPGAPDNRDRGASHGGMAAYECYTSYVLGSKFVYDDPFAPVEPGSGSGGNLSYTSVSSDAGYRGASHGGGALRIVATGVVTVNGSILADAIGCNTSVTYWNCSSGGAGGSVWITAKAIAGNGGVISARGGDAQSGISPAWYWFTSYSACSYAATGGGGMIRLEYTDAAAQEAATLTDFTITAGGGEYLGRDADRSYALSVAERDRYRCEADLGTLTFGGGTAIIDKLLGHGLTGRILGLPGATYTYDDDLVWTAGHVRFADEGVNVTFEKSLTLQNVASRLEIGGMFTATNETVHNEIYAGTLLNKLLVKQNFTLANGAAFDIRAAETNAHKITWGGLVRVEGNFVIGDNAIVHPWCDVRDLGAPHFEILGNFSLAETATIDADRRGGAAGWSTGSLNGALRPNRGFTKCGAHGDGFGLGAGIGAGHGGLSGKYVVADNGSGNGDIVNTSRCGKIVGDEWTAAFPGAGSSSSGYSEGGHGGGLVYIECAGDISINGRITAMGYAALTYPSVQHSYTCAGGGAGGSIRLLGKTVTLGSTASLSVQGGPGLVNEANKNYYVCAAGGGGRIVIGQGGDVFLSGLRSKFVHDDDPTVVPSGISIDSSATLNANGGTPKWSKLTTVSVDTLPAVTANAIGEAGTIRYISCIPKPGSCIIVR